MLQVFSLSSWSFAWGICAGQFGHLQGSLCCQLKGMLGNVLVLLVVC